MIRATKKRNNAIPPTESESALGHEGKKHQACLSFRPTKSSDERMSSYAAEIGSSTLTSGSKGQRL